MKPGARIGPYEIIAQLGAGGMGEVYCARDAWLQREVAPFVRAGAQRALAIDPQNERPRFVLGAVALAHDYDWEAATAHFAASMRGPGVPAHAYWIHASLVLHALGHFEESSGGRTSGGRPGLRAARQRPRFEKPATMRRPTVCWPRWVQVRGRCGDSCACTRSRRRRAACAPTHGGRRSPRL